MQFEDQNQVVLYLEDWQMRMVKDFQGTACDRLVVPITGGAVMKYMGPTSAGAGRHRGREKRGQENVLDRLAEARDRRRDGRAMRLHRTPPGERHSVWCSGPNVGGCESVRLRSTGHAWHGSHSVRSQVLRLGIDPPV